MHISLVECVTVKIVGIVVCTSYARKFLSQFDIVVRGLYVFGVNDMYGGCRWLVRRSENVSGIICAHDMHQILFISIMW